MESPKLKKGTPIDPLAVTESLGFQTFRRESRNPWTKKEDAELIKIIKELYSNQINSLDADSIKWDVISQRMYPDGNRKAKDCRKRWSNSLDPKLKKGKWTKDEDEKLIKAHSKHGPSWQKVSNEIMGRTDDQCAKRYIEVLDPSTKDRLKPWAHHEDLRLIQQVKLHGTKWRIVALEIKGRPSLTCRNRWRKIVTDVVRGKADPAIKREVDTIASGNYKLLESIGKGGNSNINQNGSTLEALTGDLKSMTSNSSTYPSSSILQSSTDNTNSLPLQITNQDSSIQGHNQLFQQKVARPPAPSAISRPMSSEVEWKYKLSGENGKHENLNLPHKTLFNDENGGNIKNQELVQYLVSYAKTFGLGITVHQHIHHHYSLSRQRQQQQQQQQSQENYQYQPIQTPFNILHQASNENHDLNTMHADTGFNDTLPPNDANKNYASGYLLEPETQLTRYQHFNYLPPLTEVPKLNSSNSPPSFNSKGNSPALLQHHHHHHHHHHHDNDNDNDHDNQDHSREQTNNRESDLIKLLNRNNNESSNVPNEVTPPGSNSLTPLTQAVEMAAAAESHTSRSMTRKRTNVNSSHPNKKARTENSDEEDTEEGMDFWETMRNLTVLSNLSQPVSQPQPQSLNQKPVSQHHPLHYFTSTVTPQPTGTLNSNTVSARNETNDKEEDDIGVEEYGLFYNLYTREGSSVPPNSNTDNYPQSNHVYDNLASNFDMIPFNPS